MQSAAEPSFANEQLRVRYVALIDAIRDLACELDEPQQDGDVLAIEHGLELAHRMVGAAQIDNLARIEAGRLHRIDGHRSVKAHAGHVLKLAPEEAGRRAKATRGLRELPEVAAALRSGRIGLGHVHVLVRVQANPRIKDKVSGQQKRFLRWAATKSFDDFKLKVLDWERNTDLNGGFKENERNHANRKRSSDPQQHREDLGSIRSFCLRPGRPDAGDLRPLRRDAMAGRLGRGSESAR